MEPAYDRLARFYDTCFSPMERGFLGRWRAEALGELPEGADILELGSGTGANFKYYPPSHLAVSSELSGEMLSIARTKTRGNLLVQADAQQLPFPANSFDAVFATLVFCSIPDPMMAFAEVRRVLRPDGRVVLLEHVRPPGWLGRVFDAASKATVALIDDHFDRRTAEIAATSGLRVVEVRTRLRGVVNLIVCREENRAE